MKTILSGLFTAFSLYSLIPVPKTEWNRTNMRYALCFFPLVGVVVGVASLLWYELCTRLGVVPGLFAAVAVLLPVALSGGIHMDGFIDTSDALSCHGLRQQKLEILKDPHVGAFGVVFCAGQLLLSFGLWQQLYAKPRLMALVAVGYVVSRCLNALSITLFPTAKNSGLVYLFSDSAAKAAVVAVCTAILVAMLALCVAVSPLWGGVMAGAAAGYFLLHRRFCIWEFGGNTGDLAGFLLTNMELLFLAVAVAGGLL